MQFSVSSDRQASGRAVQFEPARAQEPNHIANDRKGNGSGCQTDYPVSDPGDQESRQGTGCDAGDGSTDSDATGLDQHSDGESDDCAGERTQKHAA